MKAMSKYFPIAAVDVETAKYYNPEEMNNNKLASLLCNNKLSDIVSLSIVSIDKDLIITKISKLYKPWGSIDSKAAKIHSYTDKYFEDNAELYDHFSNEDALEINRNL